MPFRDSPGFVLRQLSRGRGDQLAPQICPHGSRMEAVQNESCDGSFGSLPRRPQPLLPHVASFHHPEDLRLLQRLKYHNITQGTSGVEAPIHYRRCRCARNVADLRAAVCAFSALMPILKKFFQSPRGRWHSPQRGASDNCSQLSD